MSIASPACTALRGQRGLTLVEVLVAMALLALLLVPAIQALQSGFLGMDAHVRSSSNHYRLVGRLETVLSESFSDLAAAAAGNSTPGMYSDAVGTPDRIVVFIAAYDADNADADSDPFTGTEDDLLWVRVAVENSTQSLVSLAHQ